MKAFHCLLVRVPSEIVEENTPGEEYGRVTGAEYFREKLLFYKHVGNQMQQSRGSKQEVQN